MSYYWVRERSNKCFQLVRQKFWIVIIVHCHCYHCSLLLSSLLIVIIIIIHYYCSSLVSLCIVAFLILLLQEYGYCGHCALLLYILCIVIVVNCSLCTNLPQSIAHCYCSTLFIVHCYSFLLSIVIGHCSHCMDLILYRTANLAPFQGNLEWYNTIFALNILFRACSKNNQIFSVLQGLIWPPGLTGQRLTLACQSVCSSSFPILIYIRLPMSWQFLWDRLSGSCLPAREG